MSQNIYTARFGDFPVRFVCKEGVVYASRDDFIAAMRDCYVVPARVFAERFFDDAIALFGASGDKTAAIVDKNTIGQVIHFHAIANFLDSLRGLCFMPDAVSRASDNLRETAFRINALYRWYLFTMPRVDDFFGITLGDMMNAVAKRLDAIDPPLIVRVTHVDGFYTAVCDDLRLVTEAKTIDALRDQVWELAPELVELNHLPIDADSMRLRFDMAPPAHFQQAM
jgi:hypothetical protein